MSLLYNLSVSHCDWDLLDLLLCLLCFSPLVYKPICRLEDHIDFMGQWITFSSDANKGRIKCNVCLHGGLNKLNPLMVAV